MVFSSLPLYLDPSNWPQQQSGGAVEDAQLPPPPRPPVPPPLPPRGGGTGRTSMDMDTDSARPGSMTERARLAQLPLPEAGLKCPRCESTNTKFCYYNNYSLTQPRHFCKTCRRYWTRGGAMRNVPVGGGCRRNKRSSKGNHSSKSKAISKITTSSTDDIITNLPPPPPPPQLPFLPTLPLLTDYSVDIGLNFPGIQPPTAAIDGRSIFFPSFGDHQWRPLLEPPAGMYQFEGNLGVEPPVYIGLSTAESRSKPLEPEDTQFAGLKVEGNSRGIMNISRAFPSIQGNDHHQYWGPNNAWTDLSAGFASSSTTNLL